MSLRVSTNSAFGPYSKKECSPSVDRPFVQKRVCRVYREFKERFSHYQIGAVLKDEFGQDRAGMSKTAYAVESNPRLIALITDLRKLPPKHLPDYETAAKNEIALHASLHQVPNIPKLHDAFWIEREVYVMILDHMGRTLWNHLLSNQLFFSTTQLERTMKRLLKSIEGLHREGIIHGDISLNNVTETGLFDFGLSEKIGVGGYTKNLKYARWNRPPETVIRWISVLKSDIWALGTVFFEIVFKEPFIPIGCSKGATSAEEFEADIQMLHAYQDRFSTKWSKKGIGEHFFDQDQLKPSPLPHLPSLEELFKPFYHHPKDRAFVSLLRKMLVITPMDRLSAKELLKHRFFRHDRYDYAVHFSSEEALAVQIFAEEQSLGTFLIPSSQWFHLPAHTSYRLEVWSLFKQNELVGTASVSLGGDWETIQIATKPFSIAVEK